MMPPAPNSSFSIADEWQAAWTFAARAHGAQKLPGSDVPYLAHVASVAMEIVLAHGVQPFGRPTFAVQCAVLHDVLEDTDVDEPTLVARFGSDVAAGVRALTKSSAMAKPEAMADSLRRIREQPPEVWAVKLADRIVNLAPPPLHWTPEKIAQYRDEAETIFATLGSAHEPLATRLAARIAAYPPARG